MKIAAIGDDIFTALWKLVGADGYPIKSEEDFPKVFEELLKSGGYSAIIVPERFADKVSELAETSSLLEKVEPVVIFVPERGLRKRVEDLRRKISMAMGVEITL